jgi:hypothetical protein
MTKWETDKAVRELDALRERLASLGDRPDGTAEEVSRDLRRIAADLKRLRDDAPMAPAHAEAPLP